MRRERWMMVALFGTALAYVEAAVVAYLRVWLDRVDPYRPQPLMVPAWVDQAEMIREAATLVMLVAVGWLAGRTWRGRCGYFLLVFGVWDTLYYVFLVSLTGWPRSPLDWDVLFLIPVPWWGPVWSPVSIALLMVIGGTLLSSTEVGPPHYWPRPFTWCLSLAGATIALYVFMADALHAADGSTSALHSILPTHFNWPLFLVAWLLLAAPLIDVAWQRLSR